MRFILFFFITALLFGCQGEPKTASTSTAPPVVQEQTPPAGSINDPEIQEKLKNMKPSANNRGLVEIKGVNMSQPISQAMVMKGKAVFDSKCVGCHSMDGSPSSASSLANLLDRREAAWVMNMIYNPNVEVWANASEKAKLLQCYTRQANQALSIEEARDYVELLRTFKEQ